MSVEEKNIGVLMQTCTLVETTRGKYNTDRGWIAGRFADVPGYCVRFTGAGTGEGYTLFLNKADVDDHVAPITSTDGLDLRPSDMAAHAELAMYAQRIGDLQVEITQRLARAKENGSFDIYVEQILQPRLELLIKLVRNIDEGLTHD